jgi:hypothetical protein
LTVGFEIDGDVLSDLLNGAGDEELAWNFYTDQLSRVHSTLYCIFLIDIKAD